MKKQGPFLEHLDAIEEKCQAVDISLREIILIFGTNSHYTLILFLILPFLQPIPMVGLSTPFGLLIALVAGFAYFKKPPFVPARWLDKRIPSSTVLKIAEGAEKIFRKISFILHPRWGLFFKAPFYALNSFLLIINAVLLALPLPIPFSNAIPAWCILIHTLAQLEEDGGAIVLSYILAAFCFVYFILIGKGVTAILDRFI